MKNWSILLLIGLFSIAHIDLSAQSSRKKKSTKKIKIATPILTESSPETTNTSTTTNTNATNTDQLSQVVSGIGSVLSGGGSGTGMTNDLAANGLKEALSQGTNIASNNLGQLDGFLANAAVKILFPPEARNIEATLRKIGMGSVCDQVITTVNRAAESAVVEAKPIFLAAITQMTLTDAIGILTGGQNSATEYLQRTSGQALHEKFQPIIQSNLDRTQATRYWKDAMTAYNAVPFGKKVNPNLSQYVTEKASEGIFKMIAEEEHKIRANPLDRVGGIIQDVFGWADKNRK